MYSQRYPSAEDAMAVVDNPHLIRVQYHDGSRAAVLVLSGLVGDTTFAARVQVESQTQIVSCLFNNVSRAAFLRSLPLSLPLWPLLTRGDNVLGVVRADG